MNSQYKFSEVMEFIVQNPGSLFFSMKLTFIFKMYSSPIWERKTKAPLEKLKNLNIHKENLAKFIRL